MNQHNDHFSAVAAGYAGHRPAYPDELFSYLAGLVDRHELAWDCAAGTGQASLPLTRFFGHVLATDLSPAMLKQIPAHPKLELRAAPAEQSGLEAGSADLVSVAQALHWLDLPSFYAEARRVLLPGGVLAVWTYGNQQVEPGIDEVLGRFYHDTIGEFWSPERRHVETGYRTLPFPLPELTPPRFAMQQVWTLAQLLGYVRTWSAVQRFRQAKAYDPVDQLEQELAAVWGPSQGRRLVRWPLSLRVGRLQP